MWGRPFQAEGTARTKALKREWAQSVEGISQCVQRSRNKGNRPLLAVIKTWALTSG